MPKVKVNDISMYYEIHGEGSPLVMIFGLAGDVNWWTSDILKKLSNNFEIIIFDNRGAGKTEKTDLEFSIKLFSEDTVGLMDALKIEKAHVLGFSMGGFIAQEVAINYPERIQSLILCSTHCGIPKAISGTEKVLKIYQELYQLTLTKSGVISEGFINKLIPLLFNENFKKDNLEFIESYKERMLKTPISFDSFKRHVEAGGVFKSGRRLKQISKPTLILHGKKDIFIPPQNGELLSNLIPGAKLKYFEDAAHLLFAEEPEQFCNTIINYCNALIKFQ